MREVVILNKKMLASVITFFFLLLTGCGSVYTNLPLPSSAKTISAKTIQIPFPFKESENGEDWTLSRHASNQNPVVQVSNKGKVVETLPININSNASITLGGKKFTVKSIKVNSDNLSGMVTLVKQ
jgi:hypothetical protein